MLNEWSDRIPDDKPRSFMGRCADALILVAVLGNAVGLVVQMLRWLF